MTTVDIGGKTVSRIALGGAGFSIREPDEDAAVVTIRAALAAGITQFDSARAYATADDPLHNELLFSRALAGEDVLIATKGGHFRIDEQNWGVDGSRDALRRDCENSLRALGTEQIGLYYLHKPDPETPLEESIGALAELRAEGKIRDIGVCNLDAAELEIAFANAPIAAVQNRFSPFEYTDTSVLDLCEERDIPFYAYSPLGGYSRRGELRDALPEAVALAGEAGRSFEQVILAWLLTLSPTLCAITGAGRPESAADSAAALSLGLSREMAETITARVAAIGAAA